MHELSDVPLSRRELLRLGAFSLLGYACASSSPTAPPDDYTGARLTATIRPPTLPRLEPGTHPLGLDDGRDGFVHVPESSAISLPLLLLLHGYGGSAANFSGWTALADELGMVLLGVDSRAVTWDVILGGFGEDVAFIDDALRYVIDRLPIDAARVAAAGFSDGASYALSIGLTNGDFFTRTIAFSPGFLLTGRRRGKPYVFISHGSQDPVLSVSVTRSTVATLRSDGYTVEYVEFEGGHSIPVDVRTQALQEI